MNLLGRYCCLHFIGEISLPLGFPGGSDGKEPACKAEDPGSNPWVKEDDLEKEMATHSSILGWEIPWTEEPGRL